MSERDINILCKFTSRYIYVNPNPDQTCTGYTLHFTDTYVQTRVYVCLFLSDVLWCILQCLCLVTFWYILVYPTVSGVVWLLSAVLWCFLLCLCLVLSDVLWRILLCQVCSGYCLQYSGVTYFVWCVLVIVFCTLLYPSGSDVFLLFSAVLWYILLCQVCAGTLVLSAVSVYV